MTAGITPPRAFFSALPQKRSHRFARGHRIFGKLVTKILESEFETRRKLDGVVNSFRQIGKELSSWPSGTSDIARNLLPANGRLFPVARDCECR